MCRDVTEKKKVHPGPLDKVYFAFGVMREAYEVARPAMGFLESSLYFYKNPNPSLWMSLYVAYFWALGINAGNDYMDWDRDIAEGKGREVSVSRGRARSKDYNWYYYMFASAVALVIGLCDPFLGALYFVITEVIGNWFYNGVFCGFAMDELSIVKSVGFPLDVITFVIGLPYGYLIAHRQWLPNYTLCAWSTTLLWAQMKDYEHEKDTKVKTSATVLGPNLCRCVISVAAVVMMHGDWRFFVHGLYAIYKCWWSMISGKETMGKFSVIMGLNMLIVTIFDEGANVGITCLSYMIQIFVFALWRLSYAGQRNASVN